MTVKDSCDQIIDNLIHSTSTDILKWVERSSEESSKTFISLGEDGSSFEVKISYSIGASGWEMDSSCPMWIRNGKFSLYITDYKYPDLRKLKLLIFNKCCPNFKPSDDIIIDKLNDIGRNISKSTHRDVIIDKIIKK